VDIKTRNTGRTFYRVEPTMAEILLELGMVERVNPTVMDTTPPEPKWGVTVTAGGETAIVYSFMSQTRWYTGHPDHAKKGFQNRNWLGQYSGPETPDNIVQLYREQLQPSDLARINNAINLADLHAKTVAKELKEAAAQQKQKVEEAQQMEAARRKAAGL